MIRVLALLPVAPLGLPLVSSDWARRLCTQPTGAQSEGAQFGLGKLPEMMVCEKEIREERRVKLVKPPIARKWEHASAVDCG